MLQTILAGDPHSNSQITQLCNSQATFAGESLAAVNTVLAAVGARLTDAVAERRTMVAAAER